MSVIPRLFAKSNLGFLFTMYSAFDLVWIAIEIVSTVLLIFIIGKLLRSKQRVFKSAFFMIFTASAMADVVSVFWHSILRHLASNMEDCLNFFGAKNLSLIYKSVYYGSTVLLSCHLALSILISLNRCTSVSSPVIHERLWCTRNTLIAITLFGLSGVPAWVFIMFSNDAAVVGEDGRLVFVDLDPWVRSVCHAVSGIVMVSHLCLCLFMSAYTVRKLFASKTAVGSQHTNTERKLCFHAIFVSIGSLLMVFQQFIKMYAAYTNNDPLTIWISSQFFWIHDVLIFSDLYSIIICSSHVRTFFKPVKYFQVQIVSSQSANSNIPTITATNHPH